MTEQIDIANTSQDDDFIRLLYVWSLLRLISANYQIHPIFSGWGVQIRSTEEIKKNILDIFAANKFIYYIV